MSGLEKLRQRVEAAESQFGMIAAQRETYSARLTGLMSRMEQAHTDQQSQIAAMADQIGRAEAENRELRGMLLGLLQAIETGDGNGVGHVVRDLEHRIDGLVGAGKPGWKAEDIDVSVGDPKGAPPAPADAVSDVNGPDADGTTTELGIAEQDAAAELTEIDGEAEIAVGDDDIAAELDDIAGEPAADADADSMTAEAEIVDAGAEHGFEDANDAAAVDLVADEAAAPDMAAVLADESTVGAPAEPMDAHVEGTDADGFDADEVATESSDAPGGRFSAQETVALDDSGADEPASSNPAHQLLSRVDAVANALMAGGFGLDADDDDLTGEISALLQDAIGAKRTQATADQAEAQALDGDGDDITIEDWSTDATAQAVVDRDDEDDIVFEQDAAA